MITTDCGSEMGKTRPRSRFRRVYGLALMLVALLLFRLGHDEDRSPPSGPGVTWNDWVEWANMTLGLRPTPPTPPTFAPRATMGDMY